VKGWTLHPAFFCLGGGDQSPPGDRDDFFLTEQKSFSDDFAQFLLTDFCGPRDMIKTLKGELRAAHFTVSLAKKTVFVKVAMERPLARNVRRQPDIFQMPID
jgi:hypothetical protein